MTETSNAPITPYKAAFQLTTILEVFNAAHGSPRFPVDVATVAEHCHEFFHWDDAIEKVVGADIENFEGCLAKIDDDRGWALIYSESVESSGRRRFTQAHELGHYVLHRSLRSLFECTSEDMDNWQSEDRRMESEADVFAANLLMPLDDFREQISGPVDFGQLRLCAQRYDVSLTAAALRWVSASDKKLVLVASNDGFVRWSSSSDAATRQELFCVLGEIPSKFPQTRSRPTRLSPES
ncbi:ImmA/IrrE family metallo-endopeptidase [Caballeronia sp. INDeC2]|uniref:ImmA/IrrE family metallo-endopeptidase n=1 Tax=Caballeronia sp. INDeC2 TaxID=2921747 RepID=UPI00202957DD|nr:ImmA/IrrE family metallo-endopeptidase [Caballeronia sp. INDeC2]